MVPRYPFLLVASVTFIVVASKKKKKKKKLWKINFVLRYFHQ
jgi:hypothetical protein